MLGKSKGGRGDWDYIVQNHPGIVEELKSLYNWDEVKSIIPEAEKLGAYHLISLQAIAAVVRELKIQRGQLSERLETLTSKLDDVSATQREQYSSLEKRLRELEDRISSLEQRTLFIDSIEAIIPRINELEERMERLPAELYKRLEDAYSQKIDEDMRGLIAEKVDELKRELERETLSVGIKLAKTLREIQEHYERLVEENIRLKERVRENESLKRQLMEKERELGELRKRLAMMGDMAERVEKLEERINAYESQLREMRDVEKQLLAITGAKDVSSALEIIKRDFIPRSKFEKILGEVKTAVAKMDALKEENTRLRRENEKLREALKMLLQGRTLEEDSLIFEDKEP